MKPSLIAEFVRIQKQTEFSRIQVRLHALAGLHANRRRIKFNGLSIVMQSLIANAIPPNPFQVGRSA